MKRSSRLSQITHSKDVSVSLWAFHEFVKSHSTIQQRHSSNLVKYTRNEGFKHGRGMFINSGDTVELHDGNFLRVKKVLYDEVHDRYSVEGWKFVRNAETLGLSKHDPNEVYWAVHLTKNRPQLAAEQALVEVDSSQIVRKRKMNMVNKIYSGHEKKSGLSVDDALFCRWKHVVITETGKVDRPSHAFGFPPAEIMEASIQRLREDECDDGQEDCIADESLRRKWLRVKKPRDAGVESHGDNPLLSAVETLSLDDNTQFERASRSYTFADVCCGAGGASWGAQMAGLDLRLALDHDMAACDTYSINFPRVRLYLEDLDDFVQTGRQDLRVDIMHGSFPCQAYSPVNTTPNRERDADNIAANMELGRCLDIARPRIATLEQTSGLMSEGYKGGRHGKALDKFIKQFTSRGYSVAWKIVNLAEFGLPQYRKRLIMIASW